MTSFLESYIRTVPQCGHGGRSWTNGYWFSLCHCNLLIAVWLPDTKDNAAPFSFLNNTVRMDLLSIHIVIVMFSNVRAIKVDIAYEHIFFSFFSFWKRPPTIICDGKRGLEVVFFHVSFSRVCVFVCVHQCTYIYIFCRETSRSATGGRGGGHREGSWRNQNGFHPLSGLFEPPEVEYIRILVQRKELKYERRRKK